MKQPVLYPVGDGEKRSRGKDIRRVQPRIHMHIEIRLGACQSTHSAHTCASRHVA